MCTAISYTAGSHYFGRNLDLDHSYQESVTVTPRQFPFRFREAKTIKDHPAMIGMATVVDGYPLYYDATNEPGLSMAGLSFAGNAVYYPTIAGKHNISPFELIPWVLCQCATVAEAKQLLANTNIAAIPFSDAFSLTDLHWIITDKEDCIVTESTKNGLCLYDNPFHVLTNNPPFEYHMENMHNYLKLDVRNPVNTFAPQLTLKPTSWGTGALGLPGDLSSASRFIRAYFTLAHSVKPTDNSKAVAQFFHILGAVSMTDGCVVTGSGTERTIYSSCCNTDTMVYHYTTYENSQVSAAALHKTDYTGNTLTSFPLQNQLQTRWETQ